MQFKFFVLAASLAAVASQGVSAGGVFSGCTDCEGEIDVDDVNFPATGEPPIPTWRDRIRGTQKTKTPTGIFSGCCDDDGAESDCDNDEENCMDCSSKKPFIYFTSYYGSGCPPNSLKLEHSLENFNNTASSSTTTFFSLIFSNAYSSSKGLPHEFRKISRSCHTELGFYVPAGWQFTISQIKYMGCGMLNNRHMSGHQSTKMYYRQDAHNPDRHVNVKTTWRGPMDGDYITIEDIPEVEQVWSECSPTNTPTNSVIFKKSETQRRSVMKLASGFSTSVLNVLSSHNITSDEDLRRRLRKEHGGLDKWEYEANYG